MTRQEQRALALALIGEKRHEEHSPTYSATVEVDPTDRERLFTLVATNDPWVCFRLGEPLREHGMLNDADVKFERVVELLEQTKDYHPGNLKIAVSSSTPPGAFSAGPERIFLLRTSDRCRDVRSTDL